MLPRSPNIRPDIIKKMSVTWPFVFTEDRHETSIFTPNTFTRINVKWRKWDMIYEHDNVLARINFRPLMSSIVDVPHC